MHASTPADWPRVRIMRVSRPADVRRLLPQRETCRRISTSSRPEGRLRLRRAPTSARTQDRTTSRNHGLARRTVPHRIRKREAIRTGDRRQDPAIQTTRGQLVQLRLVKVAIATAAGRNFRRCQRAPLLSQAEPVNPPDAVPWAGMKTVGLTARTVHPAVRDRKAAATVRRVVDMGVVTHVLHST